MTTPNPAPNAHSTRRHTTKILAIAAVLIVALAAAFAALHNHRNTGPADHEPSAGAGLSWSDQQIRNGQIIIATGLERQIPEDGIIAGLTASLGETRMLNLANDEIPESLTLPHDGVGHDHNSLGLFQQSLTECVTVRHAMTPELAAGTFFRDLATVRAWEFGSPAQAAQLIQRSGYPQIYDEQLGAATQFYRQQFGAAKALADDPTTAHAAESIPDRCLHGMPAASTDGGTR